ncbi:MAG: beta-glucuronidase [Clostridia bacterium]|nr:beta-glucuronidase [Clostridia bacterium]
MTRLFDEHILRSVKYLNGAWKFVTDPKNIGEEKLYFKSLDGGETVTVPSVWNTQSGLLKYEGVAWYEKTFYTDGGCLRFNFGAVMTYAKVWLDGNLIGSHYGGFSQFDLIVSNVEKGYHILTVRVDNSFDGQSIPQKKVDWYHYGGIIRDVTVETLVGISTLFNRLEYELSDDMTSVKGRFVLDMYNAEDGVSTTTLSVKIGNTTLFSDKISLDGREKREIILPEFTLDDIKLWDIGSPNLYDIIITTDTDDLLDKVGFRKICVEDGKIKLNGRAVEIRGVNRHEEHPDWGFAFPQGLMKKDLDIAVSDLGCNAIRGSHYPNSQEFVDMLDERGILFWSEIPMWGWGFSQSALADPVVIDRGLEMHREMVKYYYNHPCIIFWGMHNEILTATEEARFLSEKYYNFLKENGGNRLVTFATDKPKDDICLEYCDVISINQYFGWYGGGFGDWDKFIKSFRERREALGYSHKPVIMSEFGGAALYGYHTFDDVHWTEEYQANMLEYAIEHFHNDPMFVGFFIWQFCDMRTCLEAGINRARGFNNKGILNEYRKPKAAYFKVKELYHKYEKEEIDT